jgi:hypothetical protein
LIEQQHGIVNLQITLTYSFFANQCTRCSPLLSQFSQFSQSSFYSTAISGSSKDKNEPVHPTPAPVEDLAKALKTGSAGSISPESSLYTASAPEPPAPTGVVGKAKDFFRKGKEIVIQCKDGVKLLWVNKRVVKELKKAQKEEGHILTRREFQLVSLSLEILFPSYLWRIRMVFNVLIDFSFFSLMYLCNR